MAAFDAISMLQRCDQFLLNNGNSEMVDASNAGGMLLFLKDNFRVNKVLWCQLFVLDSMVSLLDSLKSARELLSSSCPVKPGGARDRWKSLKLACVKKTEETEDLLMALSQQTTRMQKQQHTLKQLLQQLNAKDGDSDAPGFGSVSGPGVRKTFSVNRTAGQCDARLGEVDRDDCCLNINNGFQVSALEECQSCGHPVWTSWTPWSSCSVQCGEGVRQRTRKCFGVGQCDGPNLKQQMEPCTGTCCDAKGWGSWNPWSPCSVSCGEQGVRRRARACAAPPHCHSLCSGASEEKEPCLQMNACPVHGSWSKWASWSPCVGTCITDSMIPVRRRDRSCSDPAPSPHTVPPGDDCQGETGQVQLCTEVNNCPVDGNWGAWSPPGPCSTTCGEGLQLSNRQCDSPAPKYGGKVCEGPSTETSVCKSKCPVDGFWSGWSNWGECSTSCVPQGGAVVRKRHRFCSNPAPSTDPPGRSCHGDHADAQPCLNVPPCPVDGGWGSWSSFTPCPVTCGLGIQLSSRKCVKPSPKHGGRPCAGDAHRSRTCNTKVPCPVDGQWAAWSSWGQCTYAHDETQKIACTTTGGLQSRTRECLHRSHGGLACEGEEMVQSQVCYDVSGCKLKGQWEGWGSWTWCGPDCGPKSTRQRQRICSPDYSEYSPTIGFQNLKATFSGIPTVNCGDPPNGQKIESQPCLNAPPCP